MDPATRERLQTEIELMRNPWLVRRGLWLAVSLPTITFIVVVAVWSEFAAVREAWPMRNAVEATGKVLNHTTTKLGVAKYLHLVEYSFRDERRAGTHTLAFHSASGDFIEQGDEQFVLKPGTRLKVYYDPQGSFEPQLFDDPREAVWGGLARLGVVAAFFAGIMVVVTYVSLNYRPQSCVPSDTKFQMPKEMAIPPDFPVANQ